jgi:hypothetical protein
MDPASMRLHAEHHRAVAELVEGKLDGLPGAVDGGIASDVVVAILDRVATGVGDLADLHLLVAGVIDEVVTDSTKTDDATAASFQQAIDGMDGS